MTVRAGAQNIQGEAGGTGVQPSEDEGKGRLHYSQQVDTDVG